MKRYNSIYHLVCQTMKNPLTTARVHSGYGLRFMLWLELQYNSHKLFRINIVQTENDV